VRANGVYHLCKAMVRHPTEIGVLEEGSAALANLALEPVAVEAAKQHNAGWLISRAMSEHLDRLRLQIFGVAALDSLGHSGIDADLKLKPDAKPQPGGASAKLKGVSELPPLCTAARVCAAMASHASSGELRELGCRAIANLAQESDVNRRAILAASGALLVCTAMEQDMNAARLQRHGCAALANLAIESAAVPVVKAGGIQRVSLAMEGHLDDPAVQEEGCSAIANIACADSVTRLQLAKAGGAVRVCEAMRRHPAVPSLQQEGLAALANLCWGDMQKRHVQDVGGVDCIFAAVNAHLADAEIQEWGCKALHNLACNNDALRRSLIQQGALAAICNAMREHGANAGVQQEGCVALASLAKEDEHAKAQLERMDGVQLVIAALRTHRDDAEMQRWGFKALRSVAAGNAYDPNAPVVPMTRRQVTLP